MKSILQKSAFCFILVGMICLLFISRVKAEVENDSSNSCEFALATDPQKENHCVKVSCDPQTGELTHIPATLPKDRNPCSEPSCDPATGPFQAAAHEGEPCTISEIFLTNSQSGVCHSGWCDQLLEKHPPLPPPYNPQ